jgi:hypothetical protein
MVSRSAQTSRQCNIGRFPRIVLKSEISNLQSVSRKSVATIPPAPSLSFQVPDFRSPLSGFSFQVFFFVPVRLGLSAFKFPPSGF